MTGPGWWNERRFGMFVQANIATVASFSPIGERADWYWNHLGSDLLAGTRPHASPLAEVLAYHRDRWSHVERYDDFIPFLSFHRFDADELAELALAAGMGFVIQTAKHRDGFCWWDAPGTERTSVQHGPRRDIVAETSAACRRNDLVFGTQYSVLDWSDPRFPAHDYIEQVVQPQVLDLVERYGSQIMWGDGRRVHDGGDEPDAWKSADLIERAQDLADLQGFELCVNEHWQLLEPSFVTYDHTPPTGIHRDPWALHRSLGSSRSYNRAERAEHLATTGALFDLLTEVVAKGGNLLLDVGPGVDGTVGDLQQRPLREVGAWVNAHADVIDRSRPFDQWGDAQVRYAVVDDGVVAIDLAAGAEIVLAGLTPDRYDVSTVVADDGGALHWEQHGGGVTVTRIDRSPTGLAGLYRIALRPAVEAIRLFDQHDEPRIALQPLVDAADRGAIVQLGDGSYQGPVVVPEGVTVRGMGWDRTSISAGIVSAVRLEDHSRLEGVQVTGDVNDNDSGDDSSDLPGVTISGSATAIVGCRVDGPVVVDGHDAVLRSVIGTGVVVGGERVTIERCSFKGRRADVGIAVTGGFGHRIVGNELVDHLCSIRLREVSASTVAANRCEARWWAVHLVQCDHVEVVDNNVRHTMRAVDVDGGNGSTITANWVADGDSGALVENGATDTSVIDNHVERCRVGVLVWDAPTTRVGPNTFVDIHEEDPCVFGPDAEL